jgi:hypothetical protein
MIDTVQPSASLPCIQGQFGPRLLTYATQLPPGSIETVLGHDPRSKHWKRLPDDLEQLYKHLQRATKTARMEALIRYARYRFTDHSHGLICGAFPAISIAVQQPQQFEALEGSQFRGAGLLHFDLSARNRRVVVDGLARASAGITLVEWSESTDLFDEAGREELRTLLKTFTLPVVFYMPPPGDKPLSLEEMQQLFHDFNFRVTPVPARIAIALDHSDLYITAANKIGASDLIARLGGMERRAASLGQKSTAIVVQQNLVRFVRAAAEGESFIEAKGTSELENPRLNEETLADFEDRAVRFLTALVDGMGQEKFVDRESMHLTAPGWGALGVLFHDLVYRLKVPDFEAAGRAIGSRINWHRSAGEWEGIVVMKPDKEGHEELGLARGGAQVRRFITIKVRETLGIVDQLNELDRKADLAAA